MAQRQTMLFAVLLMTTATLARHNHISRWSTEQAKWLSRTGPSTTLTLFRTLTYNASQPHLVFSPLALKLTLLSLGALSTPSTEQAINRFLFSQPVSRSMLRQQFSPGSEPQPLTPVNSNTSKPCLFGFEPADPSPRVLAPDHLTPRYCDELSPFLSRLCHAYSRTTLPLEPTELSRAQKIALCHTFSISDFSECIQSFIGDPRDFCTESVHEYIAQYNANFTNADIAWQEARLFHRGTIRAAEKNAGAFIHRVMLLGEEMDADMEQKVLWNRALDWFMMKSYTLPKEGEAWEGFKRDHLPNELYELDLHPRAPSLLNLIHFDLKLNRTFYLYHEKTNFFTSTGAITQVDTFISNPDHFPIVLHQVGDRFHTLLRIPYEDPKYSLVLLLPDANSSISETLASLEAKQLDYYFKRLLIDEPVKQKVVLTLPRFNLTTHFDFGPYLVTQNLTTFNLTRVSPRLVLNGSIHQYIQLSNLGIRGEPAQLVLEARTDAAASDVNINDFLPINRPFVYLLVGSYVDLHHKPAFEVLLAGYYNGPL